MSFSFCDKINSGDNMFDNIKAMLDKENGAISLIQQSKTGKMNIYGKERLSAKLYVYEAFKPILDANNISKKDYLASTKQEKSTRKVYLTVMSAYLKEKGKYQQVLPELYESGHDIDVDKFTSLLQQVNEQWLEMQKNIEENKDEPEIMQELRTRIPYLGFAKATPEQRDRLLQIARDRNRTEDKKVYQQLQEYIEEKEGVDRETYLASSELRGKYRKEYQKLREYLEQNPKLEVGTLEENITYTVNNWNLILSNKKLVSDDARRDFISRYSITEFAHLSIQEANNLYNQSNQEFQNKVQKDQDDTRKAMENLDKRNRETQDAINQIYNDFFAREIIKTTQEYEDMMSMEEMLSSDAGEKSPATTNSSSKK